MYNVPGKTFWQAKIKLKPVDLGGVFGTARLPVAVVQHLG